MIICHFDEQITVSDNTIYMLLSINKTIGLVPTWASGIAHVGFMQALNVHLNIYANPTRKSAEKEVRKAINNFLAYMSSM